MSHDGEQCPHLEMLPPLPSDGELAERRKKGWKKRRRKKHPPLEVPQGGHPLLGDFSVKAEGRDRRIRYRWRGAKRRRSVLLSELCDDESRALDRLRFGWLLADTYQLDGLHVQQSIGQPVDAYDEAAPYYAAAALWREWAIG